MTAKIKKEKIAVFDLDDTLYSGNSHFAILNHYYNTKFFTSISARFLGKFFPALHLKVAYYFYHRIPQADKCKFKLPYRIDVLNLFKQKQQAGYHVVIVSNAPQELLKTAADELDAEWLKAGIGGKADCLKNNYVFGTLFVCTDNKTDLDLLNIADEAVITCPMRHRNFFNAKLKHKNYKFIEDVCQNAIQK